MDTEKTGHIGQDNSPPEEKKPIIARRCKEVDSRR